MALKIALAIFVLAALTALSEQQAATDPRGTLVSNGASVSPFTSSGFTVKRGNDQSSFDITGNNKFLQASGSSAGSTATLQSNFVTRGRWCLLVSASLTNAQLKIRQQIAFGSGVEVIIPSNGGSRFVTKELAFYSFRSQKFIITASVNPSTASNSWTAKVDNIKYQPCGAAFVNTGASITPFTATGPIAIEQRADKAAFGIASNRAILVAQGASDSTRTTLLSPLVRRGKWCLSLATKLSNARLGILLTDGFTTASIPYARSSDSGAGTDGYRLLQYNYTSRTNQRFTLIAEKIPGGSNQPWSVQLDSIQYKPC